MVSGRPWALLPQSVTLWVCRKNGDLRRQGSHLCPDCVMLGKQVKHAEPQFLHLENGHKNMCLIGLLQAKKNNKNA